MSVNATNRWDAEDYKTNAAFVPTLGAPVVDLLAPQAGERILDLGAGDGALTVKLVEAGATVVGVDASPEMIAAARARGLDAHVADGQALAFGPQFDAVFSNAALHWMLDPPAVARGVFAALRPGGRFVGEMGGQGNIATLRAALHAELKARGYQTNDRDPQWYAAPDEFVAIYEAAGFTDISATLIPRPTPLPAGVAGWLRTFRTGFLDAAGVPDEEQHEVAQAVEARLEAAFRQPDGSWLADYVRLRFSMRKPT
ncbi:class I SAM-dependent methyltransferase [Sphingomonas oryzagri]